MPKMRYIRDSYYCVLVCFHGERVDCMGLLAFLAIKYYNNNRNNKNTIMKIGVIAGCVVVLFVAVGMLRTGADNLQLKKY